MKKTAMRSAVVLAVPFALALPTPSMAQIGDDIVLSILRQCGRIDDATARLACYDNNIRTAEENARNSTPGNMRTPTGGAAPITGNAAAISARNIGNIGNTAPSPTTGRDGFGAETIRASNNGTSGRAPVVTTGRDGFGREAIVADNRFETRQGELDALTITVTSVSQQNRGMYLLTLDDGAQWQFTESVDFSYRPPREGSEVTITRASLGSFLMRFDGQQSVRVTRKR